MAGTKQYLKSLTKNHTIITVACKASANAVSTPEKGAVSTLPSRDDALMVSVARAPRPNHEHAEGPHRIHRTNPTDGRHLPTLW